MTAFRYAAIAVVLFLTGCLEYHTTTTVRDDGSIVRSVAIRGDSASTHRWDFVVPVDSTWTWERVKTGEREWTLTARREFASAEAFNDYQLTLTSSILRSTVSVERSFRWFTTTYRYREHLPSFNPLQAIPLSDFIAPKEVDAFLLHEVQKRPYETPGDSLALEDMSHRTEAWARRNEFEALYGALQLGLQRLQERSFTPESLAVRKEDLARAYEALKDTGSVFDAEDFVRRKDEWLKRASEPVVRRAAAAAKDSIDGIVAQLRSVHRLAEFPHISTVMMPGVLTSTNARTIDGSSAKWEDYLIVLYFREFDLEAESSVTNWWAVIVTAIIVVGAPMVWLSVRRRKR